MKKHSSLNKNETLRLKFYEISMYVDFISHKRKKAFMSCLTELHPRNQACFPMIFLMKAPLER